MHFFLVAPTRYLLYQDFVLLDDQLKTLEAERELELITAGSKNTEVASKLQDFIRRRQEFVANFRKVNLISAHILLMNTYLILFRP